MNIGLYTKKNEDVTKLLNVDLLKKEFDLTISNNLQGVDILICVDSFPKIFPIHKTILIQRESPLTDHRIWTYKNFHKFHTVITHFPVGENQFKFTEKPEIYPWNPLPGEDRIRENTTIKNRIIFYTAQKNNTFANVPDRFLNITTLYDVRAQIAQDLSEYPNFKLYGFGWPKNINPICGLSTKSMFFDKSQGNYNWDYWDKPHINKFLDIDNSEADFILVLENTIQPNLITEKIHDGFMSDRVVLYFGEPNIEKHIPKNCFIDLRPFFDKENKKIDAGKIINRVNTISQEEYNEYIKNARLWRKSIFGKWEEERDKLTEFLIKRIKQEQKNPKKEKIDMLKSRIYNLMKRS